MDAKILGSAILATSVLVGGCGFKSDLFQPESESAGDLFKADSLPQVRTNEVRTNEQLPNPPRVGDDIMIDKVTTEASDGRILVTPENEIDVDITGEIDGSPVILAEENLVEGDGVIVDISELERELEENRKSQ